MTRSLLLLALFASGCVILPTTKTTLRAAGTEASPVAYGNVKQVTLQTGSSPTDVRVRATKTRECHRQIFAVTEVTKSKHARLGVDDPRGRAIGFFLSPVTIPVSAIITGLIVAVAEDETSRVTKPLRVETSECTTEADGLALELQFPTGHIYRGTTDANGVLVLAIPRDEPYGGDVAVRAGTVAAQLHYQQPLPPVTAARDAIERCSAEHRVADGSVRLSIDARGLVSAVSAADAAFDACVRTRISGVVFPSTLRNRTVVLPFAAPTT